MLKEKYEILSECEKTKKYENFYQEIRISFYISKYCQNKRISLDVFKELLERNYSLKYDDFLD